MYSCYLVQPHRLEVGCPPWADGAGSLGVEVSHMPLHVYLRHRCDREQALGECGFEGTVRCGPEATVPKGQAGRKTREAGSCGDVEDIGAAVARGCTDSPV